MTSTRRPWAGPVLVVLGALALLGDASLLHVLLLMSGLWWLLTRTGSRGRHAATAVAPVQAPPMRRSPGSPVADAAYWPVLPAAAGAAAAWYANRDTESDVSGSDDEGDDSACTEDSDTAAGGWHGVADATAGRFDGSGGGGGWSGTPNDFGGSGGGGGWDDDFGGYGGGGSWDDDFGGYGGGGDWDDE